MKVSKLINDIVTEWAYRVHDGKPTPTNKSHITELSAILSEMGLGSIKHELIQNLVEADSKQFTNPILNKKIRYKDEKGKDREGVVGNLLRLPKTMKGRIAAEKVIPKEDTPERNALNKDLGSEKFGKNQSHATVKPTDTTKPVGQPQEPEEPSPAAMYTSDPAMMARLDTEKSTLAKLTAKKKEAQKAAEEVPRKEHDDFNPINPQDIHSEMPHADTDAFSGKSDIPYGLPSGQSKKISMKIDELAKATAEAKAKGESAPNFNLCKITVPGTNLYCDNNLGIPREDMPQFKGKPQPGTPAASMPTDTNGEVDTEGVFKKMLEDKGIKVLDTEIPSDALKATQSELVGSKVAGMAKALDKDPNNPGITAPIYVSRDGYVIDGHHRWAAVTSNAIAQETPAIMKVHVIDMDAKDIIPMANKFAEKVGVAAKKADANQEGPKDDKNPNHIKKIHNKIKNGIKGWANENQKFFLEKQYKQNSAERRTWSEAVMHKARGSWDAVKHHMKEEAHTLKHAGIGAKNFFSGKTVEPHQRKALRNVATKVVIGALSATFTGGLAHGVIGFAHHIAVGLVPDTIQEILVKGVGKAALFAGDEDESKYIIKFAELIGEKLSTMKITPDMMLKYVDSFNEKNKNQHTNEIKLSSMLGNSFFKK